MSIEYALKVDNVEADLVISGKKKMFIFDFPLEKSNDDKYYLMSEEGIVGSVKLGYSFGVDESVFDITSNLHMMTKRFDTEMYGYRILEVDILDEIVKGSIDDSEGIVYKIQMTKVNFGFDICKIQKTEEQRIVAAAVLIPGVPDLHKQIYDEETVTKAAHYFMENYLQDEDHGIDVMHDDEIVPSAIRVLQSYVLDEEKSFMVDVNVLDDEHPMKKISEVTYPKGTWIMVAKVLSDDLWDKVKKGEYTGWSIAGLARVRELRKLLSYDAKAA